ncbi:MAG: serine hydrolase, partial [Pseudomonadota bacterium]
MRWVKRIGAVIGALALVAIVAGLIYREEIERLYRVNTLFDEDRIVSNFSNMETMFLSAPIPRSGPVWAFGEAPAPLPETFVGVDGEQSVADYLASSATTSLLVIRNDRIEFEDYYLGTGPEDLRISWSVAKSFLSALVGIAVKEGAIASLDDPVTQYAPILAGSGYDGATIRNVANMASGVAFNEDYLDYDSDINKMGRALALGGSLDEFSASITATTGAPGEAWRYVSIDTHVLGMVLRAATGASVADYMAEKLWSKIGVEADAYYLTDAEGAAFVLGGLNIRTRDYARFGRLILNDGVWEGERVLPEGWVEESTAISAPPPAEAGYPFRYGYQWWTPPDADEEIFAIGVYGQWIWIDRKAKVVVVRTSANRNFRANNSQSRLDSIA